MSQQSTRIQSCWSVLRKGKGLLFWSAMSLALPVLWLLGVLRTIAPVPLWFEHHPDLNTGPLGLGLLALLLAVIVVSGFCVLSALGFLNTVQLICLKERLQGKNPTLLGGLSGAVRALPGGLWASLRWCQPGAPSQNLTGTLFTRPVMIFEGQSRSQAVLRSQQLVRQSWGPQAGGYLGLPFYALYKKIAGLTLIGSIVASVALGSGLPFEVTLKVLALVSVAMLIAGDCLGSIFTLALYLYASTQEVPPFFDGCELESMEGIFKPRQPDSGTGLSKKS